MQVLKRALIIGLPSLRCPTGQCHAFCLQAVSYVDPVAVMLESGTRNPSALPGALYGCPYPSSQGGECRPPASCNCYQVHCSVQSMLQLIQLLHHCQICTAPVLCLYWHDV